MTRNLLPVSHMGGAEQTHPGQAFAPNGLSTAGAHIAASEKEFESRK